MRGFTIHCFPTCRVCHDTLPSLASKNTVNNRFRALRAFLNWSVAEGIIGQSPMRNIRAPFVGRPVIPVFTAEHVKALLYLCPPNTWWGARDRVIILTLLHTGVRLSELAGITLQDMDLVHDTIRVRGKGDKQRTIYLAPEVQRAILQYLRHRTDQDEHLWISRYGDQLSSGAIRQMIRDLGVRAQVKGVRCSTHKFRHTFAVNFLRSGGEIIFQIPIYACNFSRPRLCDIIEHDVHVKL